MIQKPSVARKETARLTSTDKTDGEVTKIEKPQRKK